MAHISIYCGVCFWSAGFPPPSRSLEQANCYTAAVLPSYIPVPWELGGFNSFILSLHCEQKTNLSIELDQGAFN